MTDALTPSPNPHRLYRNPARGIVFGVCAGIADYFGRPAWQVRLAVVIAACIFPPHVIVAYLIAAVVLRRRPDVIYRNPDEETFWRAVSGRPVETFSAIRHKFRELDLRLIGLERHVTSAEFDLNRQFRDLEKGRAAKES